MADDAATGLLAWSTVNNAKISDNNYSMASNYGFMPTELHYLKATNFGFSIPAGATINGIVVEVECSTSEETHDEIMAIIKADGTIGSNVIALHNQWPISDAYRTFGGASDLWGETWSASGINDVDFGVAIAPKVYPMADAFVDHIRSTVYYTEGGPAAPSIKAHIGSGYLGAGRY
jgi:hypothetical protein